MTIDSIIFDLDGTMWDSTEVVLKSWQSVLNNHTKIKEPITLEALQGIMGMQVQLIGKKLFPYLDENELTEIMESCGEAEGELILKEGGVLYPHLEEVLKTLSQKYPLFIVSNCQSGYIEAFLEYHQFHSYFKDIECAGNTGLAKGENIKSVIQRNGLEHPIYVGDIQADADAAEVAGIPFVFADYGFGQVEKYHFKISTLSDMIELLNEN